ncbi:unnamed protein product [Cylindrotheca closterium]|uniref:Sialate O-acetylesterase domain-containing protein n=1 Tax=Cylindrotheca closterium TaxID=2856 RepID=A0AAD2CE65_9STRA|nr:unnamed protein product [Cylindrotheca closterium]
MVLQREPHRARVWGWASPTINVTAQLDDKLVAFGIANARGNWKIELPPQSAGAGHTLTISDGSSTIVLKDIAFGDVFLCSGQSNMQLSVQGAMNADAEIADSIHYPNLRLATVTQTTSGVPEQNARSASTNYTWARSSPEAFQNHGRISFSYYSATCYFFGRDLYKRLGGKIPIGLVTSCWGGQRVEAFSSPDALADASCGGTVLDSPTSESDYLAETSTTSSFDSTNTLLESNFMGDDDGDDFYNNDLMDGVPKTSLWYGMISPLLPMRFAGAVWYQGESNADNATSYACRFPAMIADWRRKFELEKLPFYYVELAGYKPGVTWPYLRAAQRAALQLDQVSFATAMDLADPSSPNGAIHPRRKQEVGRRLSLSALATQYQKNDIDNKGPQIESFEQDGSNGRVLLKFSEDTAATLHLQGSADCGICCSIPPFEIMDATGNWTRVARSRVERPMSVALEQIPKGIRVLGIRYAWEAYPQCILYNGKGGPDDHEGLPATPFETCLYPSKEGSWTGRRCRTSAPEVAVSLEIEK